MRRSSFVRIAGGRRVFRRVLPADIAHRMGKREIVRSLGSLPGDEARRRALAFAVHFDRFVDMARKNPTFTAEELDALAREGLPIFCAEQKAGLPDLSSGRRPSHEDRIADKSRMIGAAKVVAGAVNSDAVDGRWEIFADVAEELLRQRGWSRDLDSPHKGRAQVQELAVRLSRAYLEALKHDAAELEGEFGREASDPLFKGAATKASKKRLLSEVWRKYRDERCKDGDWQIGQERASENAVELLRKWHGDRPIDSYQRKDLYDFTDMLRRLPKAHGKAPSSRDYSLKTILADAEKSHAPTLAPATIFKHATQLGAFFRWCVDREFITTNPAERLYKKPKSTKRAKDMRDAWTDEETAALFKSPIWQGQAKASESQRRNSPGREILRDSLYWIPALLALHPVRLEEMAQLRVTDIKSAHGIVLFDITTAEDPTVEGRVKEAKKVKSAAGHRKVPLHSAAIALGFLEHVKRMQEAGEVRVFPDLKVGGQERRFGFTVSKWFPRYRREIGLREGLTLHGLRHSVATRMVHAEVDQRIINQVMGHDSASVSSRYAKDFPLPAVKEAIEKVNYPGVDFAALKRKADAAGRS